MSSPKIASQRDGNVGINRSTDNTIQASAQFSVPSFRNRRLSMAATVAGEPRPVDIKDHHFPVLVTSSQVVNEIDSPDANYQYRPIDPIPGYPTAKEFRVGLRCPATG
ncbi:MAG: hypothetical protein ACRERX_09360 [Pseudomonas sp.]